LIGENEMYCPRCGSQNTDATKYCRQCGLPLAQVMDYVATGGTGTFAQPPSPPPLLETSEFLALKQKRILTILSVCIAPVAFAIVAGEVFKMDDIVGVPFLLVPIGVVWATFRYKMQLRRLQERQLQEYYARQNQSAPQQAQGPKLILVPQTDTPQVAQLAQMDAPRTNPLAEPPPGSVVEDETWKLPEQHG
jgi:zinc-ribbon domain